MRFKFECYFFSYDSLIPHDVDVPSKKKSRLHAKGICHSGSTWIVVSMQLTVLVMPRCPRFRSLLVLGTWYCGIWFGPVAKNHQPRKSRSTTVSRMVSWISLSLDLLCKVCLVLSSLGPVVEVFLPKLDRREGSSGLRFDALSISDQRITTSPTAAKKVEKPIPNPSTDLLGHLPVFHIFYVLSSPTHSSCN